jgi:signal transduction histidine kinase
LLEAILAAVTLCVVALASVAEEHKLLLLSYLFLPVGVEAVLFGWRRGFVLAAAAVALVTLPGVIPRIESALGVGPDGDVGAAGVVLWSVSLVGSSVIIGRISERGRTLPGRLNAQDDPVLAVEKERARISHDIHDGLTQSVAAALMETEILQSMVADSRHEVVDEVRRLKVIIGSALQESRSMIGHLRPPPLDPGEFPETLTRLFEEFEQRSSAEIRWSVDPDFSLHTYGMRICVYRVLQEALNNIEQHARATTVRLRVRESAGAILLSVTDDGIGFDPAHVFDDSEAHYGLLGMEERVKHLGGLLDVISSPGSGTIIRAFVPGRPRHPRTR